MFLLAMVFYCSNCWSEIGRDEVYCSHCGADQRLLEKESFVKKLTRALHHPEPETPLRAAQVLGDIVAEDALPDLMQVLCATSDPYLAAACAKALGKIGNPAALTMLRDFLSTNPSVIVRHAVEEALATTHATKDRHG